MSTLNLDQVVSAGEDEAEAIAALAERGNFIRMYKLANTYGDKKTHTNYYTVENAQDEIALFSSPHVHNVVLVFDRGAAVYKPVVFTDSDEGREISGIDLL